MRIVKLTIFIMFFAAACANTYSQRCGDGIWLNFKKDGQKFYDSSDIKISLKTYDRRFKFYNDPGHTEMLLDTLNDTATYITYVNEMNAKISAVDSNKLYFPTGCGFFRMEFIFTDITNGDIMKVIIHKIPHDIPIKLNNIVFSKREYEFSFNWVLDALIFKEDKDGIYNFDFSYFKAIEE